MKIRLFEKHFTANNPVGNNAGGVILEQIYR